MESLENENSKAELAWSEFAAGDKAAFRKLFEAIYGRLLTYCIGFLKNTQQAEDVVADILKKLLEMEEPLQIKHIESWIFTVAKNRCITIFQTENRRKKILESLTNNDLPNMNNDVEQQMNHKNIDRQIKESLSAQDHKIWILHQQGYKNNEIAETVGMSEKTVANRKSEIRSVLKNKLFKHLINR